jgi:hypothetical protein
MGRRPIDGKRAMTPNQRKDLQRERERQRASLDKQYARISRYRDQYCNALWLYAKTLEQHRRRFKTDKEFRIWIAKNEFDDFGRDDGTALLEIAKYLHWDWLLDGVSPRSLLEHGPKRRK